ncbi:ankyrin repeat domain-containing protein 27-like isoform X1 [Uloborus diversus]|uniref:ankyrin repeat domain-containing protein 27-like isoform X1 n=1 Tax=Uloborus diversus TaxID=327109 RepID=UPI002409F16F|nr:ankyrin repeat domain-containing protein 27-like isoform X1 [Uloborus diversus]
MNSEPVENSECVQMASGSMSKRHSECSEEEPVRKIPKLSGVSPLQRKLYAAVLSDDASAVHDILQSDPNIIDMTDSYGNTALHKAVRYGREEIVRMLLVKGACTNLQDEQGRSPLHDIVCGCFGDEEESEYEEFKPTQLSLNGGCIRIMKELLTAGADVLLQEESDCTPLHFVLVSGNVAAAAILVDVKSENYRQDYRGDTPLHLAAWGGYIEIVEKLLAAGVNTRVQNKRGETPFHIALNWGNHSLATILVDADSENNLQDEFGQTSLHLAARYGFVRISRKLLFCGAHPHVQSRGGEYPLGIALKQKQGTIVEMILLSCALRDIVIDWEDLVRTMELS